MNEEKVKGSVLPPREEVPPGCPCGCPHPYRDHHSEAWASKVNRDFEEFSDRLHQARHDERRLKEKLDDERFDTQVAAADRQAARDAENSRGRDADRTALAMQREDTRAEKMRLDDRQAKREEDRGKRDDELTHHRLQTEQLLLTAYLERNANIHAMTLQIFASLQEGTNVARSATWNIQFLKAIEQALASQVQDAVSVALKELMGPSRGGTTPAPQWGFPPGQPTPTTGE